ncbi:hypothetical protein EP7_000932 [Isosphaeraceae bacterium EP7]
MNHRRISPRPSRLARAMLLALSCWLLPASTSPAQTVPLKFVRTAPSGFGDRQNSYPWSMQWFKGSLYVGTNRNFQCVENATSAFYFPILKPLQAIFADPDTPCPGDPTDLDLRAEVWKYTPATAAWTRVYQSDTLPNPLAPGKQVARDIGYRDMVTFREKDGTESLYLVGCSAREYTPGLPPPRILRMTIVGSKEVFQPIPQDRGTFMGDINAITFRATAVYNNKLYITASPGLTGDGYVIESDDPRLGNNSFRQVTDTALHVYEMSVFNGRLYLGAGDSQTGYSVWRTDATGPVPYSLTPVVTDGAGRGKVMTSVVSMYPFKGRLYVGSAGWYSTLLPSSELIRINPNDSWDLISGNPRFTNRGLLFPLSGLSDGFGNPFNAHIWRMQEHNGTLYAGTNDDSWGFRRTPLDPYFRAEYGFDLFSSQDGVYWAPITRTGFGNLFNFGLRTFASTPSGLFVGTVNYAKGTEIWLGNPTTSPLARTGLVGGAPALARSAQTIAAPARVEAELQGDRAVLSWEPAADAVRFRVFRSTHQVADIGPMLGLNRRPEFVDAQGNSEEVLSESIEVVGPFEPVGSTSRPFFRDRIPSEEARYSYYIQAIDASGRVSATSNVVSFPGVAPPISFDETRAAIAGVRDGSKRNVSAGARWVDLLDASRTALARGNLDVAQRRLEEIRRGLTTNEGNALDAQTVESLDAMVARLLRRVGLARAGALPAKMLAR